MQVPLIVPAANVMAGKRCAFCNEPFRITEHGVEAYQAHDGFFCNDFCAQAISEQAQLAAP
jgi:hypothetical protein